LWCLLLANNNNEDAFEKIMQLIQLKLEEMMRQFKNPKHHKLNRSEGRQLQRVVNYDINTVLVPIL
jgi:hypothetical protein